MNQPILFDPPAVTRRAAKASIDGRAGTDRARVLEILRAHPAGLTDEEMQAALAMNPSTQRPRRGELAAAGLVVASGATRQTRSGRAAAVWVAQGGAT